MGNIHFNSKIYLLKPLKYQWQMIGLLANIGRALALSDS
jgi:hypothetical protein